MEDLIDTTHSRHYELYRKDRLKQMGFEENSKDGKPSSFAETYTMRYVCSNDILTGLVFDIN